MAPPTLGLGVPASSLAVPDESGEALAKVLDAIESDMKAFSTRWEFSERRA